MAVEKIYIVRHGFRPNWLTTNWKSETGLPKDPPLAAYGLTQAQELSTHFLSLPEKDRPTAIFSSPYYRCLQTAKPIADALGVSIYVEHGISEWYSPAAPNTGLHPRPGSAASLQQYFPEIDPSWSSVYYPSRRGEEVNEVHERAEILLRSLIPSIERAMPPDQHRCVMLVSHAATVIALARALVGDRNLPLRVGCCTVTELVRRREVDVLGAWEAVRLGDGSPLSGGTSRDWGFEDIEISEGKVVYDTGIPGTENEVDQPAGLVAPTSKM